MNTEQSPRTLEFGPPDQQEIAWSGYMFAWRRKGVVLLGLIVGLALGYLYFLRQVPVYQSAAQVLIVEDRPQLPIEGIEVRNSSQELHAALIVSHVVIEKAVREGRLDELPSLRGNSNPVASVMGGLKVVPRKGGTEDAIVRFTYNSTQQADCPQVLSSVIAAYESFLGETYEDKGQQAIALINEAKDELQKQITDKEIEYRRLRDSSPLLMTGATIHNFHEGRQQQIETIRSEAMLENSKLKANIAAIEAAIARGSSPEALNLMVGDIPELAKSQQAELSRAAEADGDPAKENATRVRYEQDQLFPLLLEEQQLLVSVGPDHPKVVALRKRIELTKRYLTSVRQAPQTNGGKVPKPQDFYKIYVDSLREKIKMNDLLMVEMGELYETERTAARSLSTFQVQEETSRAEIDRLITLFNSIVDRLNGISLVKDRATTSTRIIDPPTPGYKVQPDLKSTMTTSGVLALLGGLALAYLMDSADRRFRCPSEIRAGLGVPVIGHIPQMNTKSKAKVNDKSSRIRPEVRTLHAPWGRVAEAFRAVRTAIYFSSRGGGHQVLQITSPNPGDGKTTLSVNLAVSIAHSGKRVLLIDADFRRPRVHTLLGANNEIGFSQVIQGSVELSDAIQETQVPNLSLLTCGKRPENPSELLTSRRLEELIALLRERYELVILDTPPILAVTDPLNVVPRVDAVLLVLRLTKSARKAGRQALDALEEVGGKVLGVVVNGVEGGRGYGDYGSYGYRYKYSYGNRDGYTSDGYSNHGYYRSDDETVERAAAGSTRNGNGKH